MLQFDKIIKLPNFCRVLKAKDDNFGSLSGSIFTVLSYLVNKLK